MPPKDIIDPSLIQDGPRTRKPSAKLTASAPIAPPKSQKSAPKDRQSVPNRRSPSVEIEEIEDEDANPQKNTPPENPNVLLDLVDANNEENISQPPQPRYSKKRTRVESDIEDESQQAKPDLKAKKTGKAGETSSKGPQAKKKRSGGARDSPINIDETPEEEIERMSKQWTSPIYGFFNPTPTAHSGVIKGKERRWHQFVCGAPHCLSKSSNGRIVRRFIDNNDATSTSNLRRHAEACWGEDLVSKAMAGGVNLKAVREGLAKAEMKDGSLTAVFKRQEGKAPVTFSIRQHTYKETRVECVRWCAESLRPFSVVEDKGFLRLMKTGRPHIKLPKARTVARDTHEVFKRVKDRIKKMLKEYDGKLSFATDAWTSPNGLPLIAVTVHLEHEGEPLCMLLDIVELAMSHNGENLAKAFERIVMEYEIEDKVLAIACDSATANDVMIESLAKLIANFRGQKSRVRCFAHVVNLVVKLILRQFDSRVKKSDTAKATTEAEEALARAAAGLEASLDEEELGNVLDAIDKMDVDGEEDDNDVEDDSTIGFNEVEAALKDAAANVEGEVQPLRLVLTKLRKVSYAVKNSPTIIKPRWKAICNELGLPVRAIPRDVTTRWNSTYDLLLFAYEYRVAIDKLTDDRNVKLRDYELSEDDWKMVAELRDCLSIFKDVTLKFSSDNPSLPDVIPAMDKLDAHLATAIASSEYSAALKASLALGKNLLNKYYSATDFSDLYRIAMILDPSQKMRYFKKAGWTDEWMAQARVIIRHEFDNSYRDYSLSNEKKDDSSDDDDPKPKNFCDTSDDSSSDEEATQYIEDELDRYLDSPRVKKVKDPRKWWKENAHVYPRLARMARDYLQIPATSVAVERVFSRGRMILSYIRSRLSAESTRALMCLGAWNQLGWVYDNDLEAAALLPEV